MPSPLFREVVLSNSEFLLQQHLLRRPSVAEDIAELYREINANIAARESCEPTSVATPDSKDGHCGAALSSPFTSSPSYLAPRKAYEDSSDDRLPMQYLPAHVTSLATYPTDGSVSKENVSRFQVRGLRKLNCLLKEADFPNFLFVHYTRVSSKPVAYVRIFPKLLKDAFGGIDLEHGAGLCPRVAHLHVSDEEQVNRPLHSLELNAVLTLALGNPDQRTVSRSRVIAKLAPPMCTAHKVLRSNARFVCDIVGRHLAAGRPLPVNYPIFYGMYLPYESLTREMHVPDHAHGGH